MVVEETSQGQAKRKEGKFRKSPILARRTFTIGITAIIIAGILLLLSAYAPTLGQSNGMLSYNKITGLSELTIYDYTLFAGTTYGDLKIYDLSGDNWTLCTIKKIASDWIYDIFVKDDLAFVACNYDGIVILNIADKYRPKILSKYDTGGRVYSFELKDNYLFVGDMELGLEIFDISDIRNIKRVSGLPDSGDAYNMRLKENILFLADGRGNLDIIDISSPKNPIFLEEIIYYPVGQASSSFLDVELFGEYVIAITGDGSLLMYSYIDGNLELESDVSTPGFSKSLAIQENFAFVTDYYNGLRIYQLDSIEALQVGNYSRLNLTVDVDVMQNYAFVISDRELKIFNVTDKTNPTIIDPLRFGLKTTIDLGLPISLSSISIIILIIAIKNTFLKRKIKKRKS